MAKQGEESGGIGRCGEIRDIGCYAHRILLSMESFVFVVVAAWTRSAGLATTNEPLATYQQRGNACARTVVEIQHLSHVSEWHPALSGRERAGQGVFGWSVRIPSGNSRWCIAGSCGG